MRKQNIKIDLMHMQQPLERSNHQFELFHKLYAYKIIVWWMVHIFLHHNIVDVHESENTKLDKSSLWARKIKS